MTKYISNKLKIVSFVSIIMVVYVHAYNLIDRMLEPTTKISDAQNFVSFFQYFVSNGLTRGAVPLFFAISGFLFFFKFQPSLSSFLAKYKKRFFTLVIPFVLWACLAVILVWILQNIPYIKTFIPQYMRVHLNWNWLYQRTFKYPLAFQLWFMKDLIVYVLISPLIYLYISKLSHIAPLPFFILWFVDYRLPIVNNEGIFFFIIGAYLAIKKFNIDVRISKMWANGLLVGWLAILILKTFLAFEGHPALLYLHRVSVLMGCLALWFGYDVYAESCKFEERLLGGAAFTFVIYAGHEPIMNVIMDGLLKVMGQTYLIQFILFLLVPVGTIWGLVGFAKLLQRYANPLYAILTGGRGGKSAKVKSQGAPVSG